MGNISHICCGSQQKFRITIIGFDDAGKRQIYEALTGEKLKATNKAEHNSKTVRIDDISIYVCYIPLGEELVNLWNSEATHSDCVIFAVDFKETGMLSTNVERIKDIFWNIVEQKENILSIFTRNSADKTPAEVGKIYEITGQNIHVLCSNAFEKETVKQGVDFLIKRMKQKSL